MHVSCILHLTTHDLMFIARLVKIRKIFLSVVSQLAPAERMIHKEAPPTHAVDKPPFHSHPMQLIRLVLVAAHLVTLHSIKACLFFRAMWFIDCSCMCFLYVFLASTFLLFFFFFSSPSFSLSLLPFHHSFLLPCQVPAGASAGGRSEC